MPETPTDGGTIVDMNYSLLRSKTFYTAVALGLVNLIQVFTPFLPASVSAAADVVGTILIAVFHLSTAMKAGAIN
jgi:hypothetical protein